MSIKAITDGVRDGYSRFPILSTILAAESVLVVGAAMRAIKTVAVGVREEFSISLFTSVMSNSLLVGQTILLGIVLRQGLKAQDSRTKYGAYLFAACVAFQLYGSVMGLYNSGLSAEISESIFTSFKIEDCSMFFNDAGKSMATISDYIAKGYKRLAMSELGWTEIGRKYYLDVDCQSLIGKVFPDLTELYRLANNLPGES